MMLLFNSRERPMQRVNPVGSLQVMQVGMVQPGLGENRWDAGGESLLRNNGYRRAVSNAYKLFRSPCAAFKK